MESKKAVAVVSLLTVLLAFFALVPPASYASPVTLRYVSMTGTQTSHAEQGGSVTTTNSTGTPELSSMNITFSDPWEYSSGKWVVSLTIPAAGRQGGAVSYQHEEPIGWVKINNTYVVDDFGWIFLNATGDVDCYISNNSTGIYWISPSPLAGTKAAEPGALPSPGADGVPGTGDDGFGDGTLDPRGSCMIYTHTTVVTTFWAVDHWEPFFAYNWVSVWTTGKAYDIVNEAGSLLNGVSALAQGEPWEFFAGQQGQGPVAYGEAYWNAFVTIASCWSTFGISTGIGGPLNVLVGQATKHVREDCVIADIKGEDEEVKIFDIRRAAKAYDQYDVSIGPDGIPNTADDVYVADPLFDAAADFKDPRKYINIFDIRRVAKDYGKKLTPTGIILV